MWEGFFTLVVLCIVMATASFLAGLLPLSLSLSTRQLRLITALGTGVLVGTSLIVIIPEGVETLYSSVEGGPSGLTRSEPRLDVNSVFSRRQTLASGDGLWRRWPASSIETALRIEHLQPREYGAPPGGLGKIYNGPDNPQTQAEEGTDDPIIPPVSSGSGSPRSDAPAGSSATSHDPHAWIGPPLILGFILMFLIDTIPKQAGSSTRQHRPFRVSISQFSFNRHPSTSEAAASSSHLDEHSSTTGGAKSSSTTIGLVIHAAADGIALGASSTTNGRLGFIIFVALMIHKAPAAFGLTSVLLKQDLSKRAARAHLIVFSLAAPIGALLTWAVVNLFGRGGLPESMSAEFATGVLLLFSGGTFLYVAMHTMQDQREHGSNGGVNGYHEVPGGMGMYEAPRPVKENGKGVADVAVMVAGMLLPMLTTFGHGH